MSKEDMRTIIQLYKAVFLTGAGDVNINLRTFTARDARELLRTAQIRYPGWTDVLIFVEDEIESFAFNERSVTNPFVSTPGSLQLAMRIVEQTADHFARKIAEAECQEIREDLLAFERADTGRIRLADFYRASLTARFFYTESKEYLQAIGALDDSDPFHGPKVIVSNYILAKSNCLAHSSSYGICCLNECDSLYAMLEEGTAGYESTPGRIISLVSSMSSSTVQAPRNLSQSLLRRLDEIAFGNSGTILLHSRLFGQWMHQAFPRECPYPHLVGTTTSLSPKAWARENGIPYRIDHVPGTRMTALNSSVERLDREYAPMQGTGDGSADSGEDLMWTLDEETFVVPSPSTWKRLLSVLSWSVGHVCFLVLAFVVVLGAMSTKANVVVRSGEHAKLQSMFV
jgi:hypothetical protein